MKERNTDNNRPKLDSVKGYNFVRISSSELVNDGDQTLIRIYDKEKKYVMAQFYEMKSVVRMKNLPQPLVYVTRVGPCMYYWPSGKVAAIEEYSTINKVHEKDFDRFMADRCFDFKGKQYPLTAFNSTGIIESAQYFDQSGQSLDSERFDVLFRQELGFEQIPDYAPRFWEYESLVDDLLMEFVYGTDRFDVRDIRGILADRSDVYLKMLEKDVRNRSEQFFSVGALTEDFLEKEIRTFIYGETKTDIRIAELVKDMTEKEVDTNLCEVSSFKDQVTGKKFIRTVYGNTTDENATRLVKISEKGRTLSLQFERNDKTCTTVYYYRNGNVAIFHKVSPDDMDRTWCLDSRNRLTSMEKARKELEASWNSPKVSLAGGRKNEIKKSHPRF